MRRSNNVQATLPAWALILCLFITQIGTAKEELDHQTHAKALAVVLSSGDPEWVFGEIFHDWEQQKGPFPIIVATEPGPLEMAEGLRLLANQIVPRVKLPRLLVVVNFGNLKANDALLAVVRRCLNEQVPVWVVGTFPEPFLDLGLSPDQKIIRLDPPELGPRLEQLRQSSEKKSQEKE